MPPPSRRFARKPRACSHCVIWAGSDGKIKRVCAHCPQVFGELDLRATYTEEQLRAAVKSSQRGHKHMCKRAIS